MLHLENFKMQHEGSVRLFLGLALPVRRADWLTQDKSPRPDGEI